MSWVLNVPLSSGRVVGWGFSADPGIISLPEQIFFCPEIGIVPTLRIGPFVQSLSITSGLRGGFKMDLRENSFSEKMEKAVQGNPLPWDCSENVWMWHSGPWAGGDRGAG